MSTSDSKTGEDDAAEPVDAEFEPAPEGGANSEDSAEPARKARKGAGWFKVSLFVIAAASIGGGSGWVAGQLMHAPLIASWLGLEGETGGDGALEARITALENAAPAVASSDLDALQARIAALEEAQDASGLRADAMEQLVRDVAGLRERVATLETSEEPQTAETSGGDAAAPQGEGVSAAALADLEARMSDAFNEIEARLDEALEVAQGAATAASDARAAARNALDAASQARASGQEAAPAQDAAALEAVSADIDQLNASLADLQSAQSAAGRRLAQLEGLSARLSELEDRAVGAGAVDRLGDRINQLDEAVSELQSSAQSARSAAASGQGLAAQALAFANLREAASGAGAFAVDQSALERVWPSAPGLADLRDIAERGAPPLEALAARFPAAALREVSGEARTYLGVLTVRRDGVEGPAASIEAALEDADLSEALRIADALEGEAAAAVSDWRETARDRQTIETALAAMARALQSREERAE